MPNAARWPLPTSLTGNDIIAGSPSSLCHRSCKPATAWPSSSRPRHVPRFPSYPNALIDEYTTPGVAARASASPMPRRSATPSAKFWLTTSVSARSRVMISRPWAAFRSSSIERLPALIHMCHGIARSSVLLTLITSAPYSASTRPAVGPASTCVKSTTRMPSSGATASPVAAPSAVAEVNPVGSPTTHGQRR